MQQTPADSEYLLELYRRVLRKTVTPEAVDQLLGGPMSRKVLVGPDLIKWSERCSGLMDFAWRNLQRDWMGYTGADFRRAYTEAESIAAWEIESPYAGWAKETKEKEYDYNNR
jgi:hypothetical protein